MKKALVVFIALVFLSGMAYAAEGKKSDAEPVKTLVEDTGEVVKTTAEGVADTLNIEKNNPITTAAESTAKVAEAGVKTATFQKIDKSSEGGSACSK